MSASAKVDGQYVDGFVELEVDANGKAHFYVPEVDTDSTVNGTQAVTKNYVDKSAYKNVSNSVLRLPKNAWYDEIMDNYLQGGVHVVVPNGIDSNNKKQLLARETETVNYLGA